MSEELIPVRSVDQLYDSIQERVLDLQERKNRGALIIRVVEPLDDDEVVNSGDIIEVVSHNDKLKSAEVIYANQIMAFHPEYGIVPCVDILAEVIDPDRMTIDDFEDLYGEEKDDDAQEAEELGLICECGEDRSACQVSQETFGIHANASYEE
jgi:hypothetical protein